MQTINNLATLYASKIFLIYKDNLYPIKTIFGLFPVLLAQNKSVLKSDGEVSGSNPKTQKNKYTVTLCDLLNKGGMTQRSGCL